MMMKKKNLKKKKMGPGSGPQGSEMAASKSQSILGLRGVAASSSSRYLAMSASNRTLETLSPSWHAKARASDGAAAAASEDRRTRLSLGQEVFFPQVPALKSRARPRPSP